MLHKKRRLLVLLHEIQQCIYVSAHKLGSLIVPADYPIYKIANMIVSLTTLGLQFQDQQSNKVFILKIFANLKQFWFLILCDLFETLQNVLVEVIDAFVDRRSDILIFDYAEDDISDEHAFEEDVELHG